MGVGDNVVGAATTNLPDYLAKYKDVDSAGGLKEPDLEKINQMQPDLIIISGRQRDYQEELSKIAPTLYLAVDASKLDQTTLVTLVNEGQLSAYGSGSRFGVIHDVFGFKQVDDQIEASTHGQSISYEYVLNKNPGLLFVIDRTKAIGGDDSKDKLATNELIAQTDAGKNNKVISLQPDVWYLSGGGLE